MDNTIEKEIESLKKQREERIQSIKKEIIGQMDALDVNNPGEWGWAINDIGLKIISLQMTLDRLDFQIAELETAVATIEK